MGRMITHRLLSPVTATTAVALVILGLVAQGCGGADEGGAASFDASTYPEQDITMVVPFGAGGGSDILSRTIASVIQELDIVPVEIVIENRTGGSGAIGYDYVAKQADNPYMLASLSVSFFTTPLLGASPVSYKDFTPIAAIAMSPYIMAVRAESPIQSVDDVKAAMRLTTGTTGVASDAALLAHMLQNQSGVTIDAVPFDGEGEIMAALLGGHLDFVFGNPVEILPNIQAGTLRAIAVSTGERLQTLPDVPSFKELGFDIEHAQVRGVLMPLGMPPEVVAYWQDVMRQVATSDAWQRAYLDRFKEEPRFAEGEEFGQIIEATNDLYSNILTELGLIQ
jgi:putative tricarboxylic transport membrane protein